LPISWPISINYSFVLEELTCTAVLLLLYYIPTKEGKLLSLPNEQTNKRISLMSSPKQKSAAAGMQPPTKKFKKGATAGTANAVSVSTKKSFPGKASKNP
jgi:hypothetical protein